MFLKPGMQVPVSRIDTQHQSAIRRNACVAYADFRAVAGDNRRADE